MKRSTTCLLLPFRYLLTIGAAFLAACQPAAPPPHLEAPPQAAPPPAAGPATEPAAQTVPAHEAGSSLLELDADALRDLRITTTRALSRPEQVAVSALGEVRVDESRYGEVGTSIEGRVVKILVAEGDAVKAGQALAELESPEVGRARASLVQAVARLELANRALARKKGLLEGGTVSQRELEESEAEQTTAEAEARAARATLSSMGAPEKGDGGRFSLVAPLTGRVLSRSLHLGERLEPKDTAFRIADLSKLWVVAPVFERDAVRLQAGGPAHILPTALPGQRLEARIARVGEEVQSDSRTVQVRIELDNPQGRLKPGMSASVQCFNPATGLAVTTVPLASVQRLEDRWVVFIPRERDHFVIQPIGRGRDLGGEVEVLSGLEPGTEIVVEGSFVLRSVASKGEGEDEHQH